MNTNTPYRGLTDSFSITNKSIQEKENFQAFKQKKYKQIDEARGKSQNKQHQFEVKQLIQSVGQRKRSILKPTTLNLKNLSLAAPIQQGPPTFDSEYEFRNLLVSQGVPFSTQNLRQQQMLIQYNLALNTLNKQYQTQFKSQSDKYQMEIMRLTKIIQTLKQENTKLQLSVSKPKLQINPQVQYCHLCSNGQVINRLNKIMKSLQQAHQNCVVNQNQASKKIIKLQSLLNDDKQLINSIEKEKKQLNNKVQMLESENKELQRELSSQKQRKQSSKNVMTESHNLSITQNLQKQRINNRSMGHGLSTHHQRSSFQQTKARPSSNFVLQPPLSKRTNSSCFNNQSKTKRISNILDQYQSQLSAAQIIDRVKANSIMGSSINPRTRILQQKKFNGY